MGQKGLQEFLVRWTGTLLEVLGVCLFLFVVKFDFILGRAVPELGVMARWGIFGCFCLFVWGAVIDPLLKKLTD